MNGNKKDINIDFLFLDLTLCKRCMDTDSSLENAVNKVSEIIKGKGVKLNIKKVHIDSEQKALDYGLEVSPTIRINGRDIQNDWRDSKCTDCGDLCECAGDISCRLWKWNGREYLEPPEILIVDAILKSIYSEKSPKTDMDNEHSLRKLNSNIKTFFTEKENEARLNKSSCC